ncbi:MAG TPA: prolyl oligopeptidase family serine peptidase [Leadbetterella sp.]|nr:prolyl oligopeptidase family serine peptidase [Leadbetterella sp.]
MKKFSAFCSIKFSLFLSLAFYFSANAQVTKETYKKAEYFLSNSIQKEVYNLEVIPNWIKDKNAFWHVTYTEDGKRFLLTDIVKKETRNAFDHELLAKLLNEASGDSLKSRDLPFERIKFKAEDKIEFEWKNKTWEFDNQKLSSMPVLKATDNRGLSPDKKWRAFTKNYNLFVENLESAEVIQLSFHGKKDYEYGTFYGWSDIIEGENGVRPEQFYVRWSPDSKKILTQIADLRMGEKMYLLDFSKDEKFRPNLLSYYRGSPGDTTLVKKIPVIFDLETKKETKLLSLTTPHFMPLDLYWDKNNTTLTGTYFHRGYKQFDLLEIDTHTGAIRTVYSEKEQTHIEYATMFKKLKDDKFILASQQSGWNNLYLIDWKTGKILVNLTPGDYVVNRVVHVDEDKKQLYFMAAGREKGRNVYYQHLYRVGLDGKELTLLTSENAFHEIYLSEDKKYVVDNYSTVNQATKSVLRDLESGNVLMQISEADISKLKAKGYQSPQQFSAISKDGKTEIYGIYYVPTDFNAKKSYPVVDYTYTGPFIDITPKTFKGGLIGLQQPIAELGFVVVTVDGIGTFGRSKAFQDVSYRNLGDGTTDHVLAIKQLAKSKPFLNIDKVGIFGHSAGGYDAARAMLLHPDFYKVGVASAGDHDHRMEKAWWPEMYMGYPVGDFYDEQSNVTNASKLKGRLLLAHGAIDENVNPSATYKFAEALIKAGKDFDMFIWPSRNHNFGRATGDYFTKKRWDYFLEHLLGQKPLLHYQIGK